MPTSAQTTFSNQCLEPIVNPEHAIVMPVKLAASKTYVAGQILGEQIGANSIQKVTISGAPTGGTFTITFNAVASAGIALNAPLSVIQAALEAVSTIGAGNVKVTGGWNSVGGVFYIEFRGTLAHAAQSAITCSVASLTGGSPAQAIAAVQVGAAGTPGTFDKCVSTNTDGSQDAKCILKYGCTTDGSGNILGPFGEHGETQLMVGAYFAGTFSTLDLVGLTGDNINHLGRLISGALEAAATSGGILRMG